MTEGTEPQKRLDDIDGLRAIAVLTVVLFHARIHAVGATGIDWFSWQGAHGVDLFFVLSGFCLAYPTLEKLHHATAVRFDLVAYALKRFLRIYPPYAVALIIISLTATYCAAHGIALPEGMYAQSAPDVLSDFVFFDHGHGHVNGSFWTLPIEFRWYFIFPIALVLAARNMRAFVTVIVLAVIAGEYTNAGSADVGMLPAFLLGIVAARVRVIDHPIGRYALPLGALCLGFAVINDLHVHVPRQANFGWHAVAFFGVVAAGRSARLRRVLSWAPLKAAGIASYSIYLVHEPIVSEVSALLGPIIGAVPATIAAIAAGLAAGFAMWFTIERKLTQRATVHEFVRRNRSEVRRLFLVVGLPATAGILAATPEVRGESLGLEPSGVAVAPEKAAI